MKTLMILVIVSVASIANANLVVNGDFENPSYGWTAWNGQTYLSTLFWSGSNGPSAPGHGCTELTAGGGTANSGNTWMKANQFALISGVSVYTFCFDAYTTALSSNKSYSSLFRYFDINGVQLGQWGPDGGCVYGTSNDAWRTISYTGTVPSNAVYGDVLFAYNNGDAASGIWFDNVSVTGPPTTPVTNGLVLDLDASYISGLNDGSVVNTWADLSGSGNNATAVGNPIYRTNILNGRPVVRFFENDGEDRFTFGNISSSFPSAATLFLVATINSDIAYNLFITNNNDAWWRWDGDGKSYPCVFRSTRIEGYTAMPTNGTYIFEIDSNSASWEMFQNGISQGKVAGNYSSGDSGYAIGSAGRCLTGDVAEVIAYNRILTAQERNSIGCYLENKYGLNTSYTQSVPGQAAFDWIDDTLFVQKDGLHQIINVAVDANQTRTVTVLVNGSASGTYNLNVGTNILNVPAPAVDSNTLITVALQISGKIIASKSHLLQPVRHWQVYLLPESHVDLGYTNLQPLVEQTQWTNLQQAIQESLRTQTYSQGSQFKWNNEVLWTLEGYLIQASPTQKQALLDAVSSGRVGLNGLFANELIDLCRPEELFQFLTCAQRLKKTYGFTIDTAMVTDQPGMTWGSVEALSQNGIKYLSMASNGASSRWGGPFRWPWGDRPFYWVSPSGKYKVLFWIHDTDYGFFYAFYGGPISSDTSNSWLEYLAHLQDSGYPYNIASIRYCISDNGPPDLTMTDFISNWNNTYAWPQIVIATTSQMFHDFENQYGGVLPQVSGDYTGFWEDGAGSSAHETALNRNAAERTVQADALQAMLNYNENLSEDFYQTWRNIVLYDEHTWGAWDSGSDPNDPNVIAEWAVKQSFAVDANRLSEERFNEISGSVSSQASVVSYVDVFNTSSWARTDLVLIPAGTQVASNFVTDGSNCVPAQRLSTGELAFLAANVPPFGSKRFYFNGQSSCGGNATANGQTLSNGVISLTLNATTGAISNLTCSGISGNLVNNATMGLNDYFYVAGSNPASAQRNGTVTITVKENGPLVASLLITSSAPGCNSLTRQITLVDGLNYVKISNTIDKKPILSQEGVHFAFPFNVSSAAMRMDRAGSVIQPGTTDQLANANENFFTIQRWVDLSNSSYGVTWATMDAPLVTVGAMAPAAPVIPSQTFYSYVMNNYWSANYCADQQGVTTFNYAIEPHLQFDQTNAEKFGIERSQPLVAIPVDQQTPVTNSLLNLTPTSVIATALKVSQDGNSLIVRIFNTLGQTANATLNWTASSNFTVWLSNPAEEKVSQVTGPIQLSPYETATLRISLPYEKFRQDNYIDGNNITATASSQYSGRPPSDTKNSAGLIGDFHNNDVYATGMWQSQGGIDPIHNPGTQVGAAWIKYVFDKSYKLGKMWVWNFNQYNGTNRGLKKVYIEYTNNGSTWTKLNDGSNNYFIFNKTSGMDNIWRTDEVDFGGIDANAVVITADLASGNWGDTGPYYGLSEVRFYKYTNLVVNGDFENSSYGWTGWNGQTYLSTLFWSGWNGPSAPGHGCTELTAGNGTANGGNTWIKTDLFALIPGMRQYTFSFDAYTTALSPNKSYWSVFRYYDVNGVQLGQWGPDGGCVYGTSNDVWRAKVSYTDIVPSNAVYGDVLFMYNNGDAASAIWFDNVSVMGTFTGPATSPSPANAATGVSITPTLSWVAGSGTSSHDVYFGTNLTNVINATHVSSEFKGNQAGTTYAPGTLSNSATYYWRIDEIGNGSTTKGSVWSFITIAPAPGQASSPNPVNGVESVIITPTLSWTAGSSTTSHDVYFGTNQTNVTNATHASGEFKGNQAGASYVPGTLSNTTVYYWRIDEVGPGGTTKGAVWSFTTVAAGQANLVVNGDFENPTYGWTAWNGQTYLSTLFWSGSNGPSSPGHGCTELTAGNGTATSGNTWMQANQFALIPGVSVYTFSFDAYTTALSSTKSYWSVFRYYDVNGVQLGQWGPNNGCVYGTSNDVWRTFSYTSTVPSNAVYGDVLFAYNNGDAASGMWFDNVSVTATVPTFVAAGTVASGTGAITPSLPSGLATNDILLLFLETANQAISISNQNGGTWTAVTNSPQGTGTGGSSGSTSLTVFWSRYNGTQGAPTTSDSGDHQIGRIIAIRGAVGSGNPWDITAGGVDATSSTSGSIPGATTTVGNTLVVTAISTGLPNTTGTSNFSSWTNSNLTSITERTDNTVAVGCGGGLGIAMGVKATAGAYGNTTVTLATAAKKGMMSIAIKP